MLEVKSVNICPNKAVVSEYIIQKKKSDSMIYGVLYSPLCEGKLPTVI